MVPYRLEKMRPTLFMICSVSINPKVSNQSINQSINHNQNLPPLLQSNQIAQLLDIKAPQPFLTRTDDFFGQH